MSTSPAIPSVERPAFFSGQRLAPEDLAQAVDAARDLRWLHNRALHAAGIALGLEVRAAPDGRRVEVSAGLALDRQGRELILAEPLERDVPNVKQEKHFRLVIRYLDDALITAVEREGACGSAGAVRRPEGAEVRFVWTGGSGADAISDDDVVLADVVVEGCTLKGAPDLTARWPAAATCEPYVAAGATDPAATPWAQWKPTGTVIGVHTRVDTAAAGFGSTPSYQVQLLGLHDWPDALDPDSSVVGTVSVTDASPAGFTARVRIEIVPGVGDAPTMAEVIAALGDPLRWHIAWMGVEG